MTKCKGKRKEEKDGEEKGEEKDLKARESDNNMYCGRCKTRCRDLSVCCFLRLIRLRTRSRHG